MRLEEEVAAGIADRYGLLLDPSTLEPFIASLLPSRSAVDDASLRDALLEPIRLRQLAEQLTIGESYFFRHPEQLQALSAWISERMAMGRRLTIWSAGCSRGEELYSIAMRLLLEHGPSARERVKLRGSDLDSKAIGVAQQGLYSRWSLRGTTEADEKMFFRPSGDGMRLVEELRTWPRFEALSIQECLEQWPHEEVDVLFFRNVGIYMTPAALTRIHRGFSRLLAHDGLLVQAATDPLPPTSLFAPARESPVGLYVPARSSLRAMRRSLPLGPKHRTSSARERARPSEVATVPTRALQTSAALRVPSAQPSPPGAEALDTALERISMLADRGQLEEAERHLSGFLALHPRSPEALLLRGQLALHRGESNLAVQALRSLLFLEPKHHVGRYWYVLALEHTGDARAAAEQLRELQRACDRSDDGAASVPAELKDAVRELARGHA